MASKIAHELYNPVSQDDFELEGGGGKYRKKFAALQVTVRLPEYNLINWIAVVYGFLPFFVFAAFPTMAFITHRFIYVYAVVLLAVCMFLSEVCLKPVFRDPRPPQTANRYPDGRVKYGMPSGHCLAVCTIMTWIGLEIQYRDELNYEWLWAVLVLCAPVPWARWHNMDHSVLQCVVGSVLGIVVGVAGFLIRIEDHQNHWWPWQTNTFMGPPGSSTSGGSPTPATTPVAPTSVTPSTSA